MARTRFLKDTGLTLRMTTVMFVLGALFVVLVVGLMVALPRYAVLIGLVGLAIVWGQWYFSDTVALRGMRAQEVSPEEDPELHGIIDRLCAMADMPKPRVGVADARLAAQRLLEREGHDVEIGPRQLHAEGRRGRVAQHQPLMPFQEVAVRHAHARCRAVPRKDEVGLRVDLA